MVNACRECGAPRQGRYHFYCCREHKEKWERENLPAIWGYIRAEILKRDGFRCLRCGITGKALERLGLKESFGRGYLAYVLQVDHIKPVRLYPELEFDRANLRTLCHNCHNEIGERPGAREIRRRDAFKHMKTLGDFT